MAIIKTLAVSVTASTSRFEKGMKRVRRSLHGTMRSMARFATSGLGVLTGAGSLAGFSALVARQASVIDQTAKMSQRLGVSFNALRALGEAAHKSGVDVNKLHMGLQRMTRRVAEASKGTGEAQSALKELGLDAKTLTRLAPDKQFSAIARALERVNSQSDRVRLAFKIFDSEGVALINLSADAIDRAAANMGKFGQELNRLQVRRVEAMNDSLRDVRRIFDGLATQIVAGLSPVIKQLADRITELAVKGRRLQDLQFGMSAVGAVLKKAEMNAVRLGLEIRKMVDRGFKRGKVLLDIHPLVPSAKELEDRLKILQKEMDILEGRSIPREGAGPGGTSPRTRKDIEGARRRRDQNLGVSNLPSAVVGGVINTRFVDPNIARRLATGASPPAVGMGSQPTFNQQVQMNATLTQILNALLQMSGA